MEIITDIIIIKWKKSPYLYKCKNYFESYGEADFQDSHNFLSGRSFIFIREMACGKVSSHFEIKHAADNELILY